jgi:hypothetical protein
LLALAAGGNVAWLSSSEVRRLSDVLARRDIHDLVFQLGRRAERKGWFVHPGMIDDVLAEDGVVVGGAKASGRLRDGGPVDLYIAADVLKRSLLGTYRTNTPISPMSSLGLYGRRGPSHLASALSGPQVAALDLLERGDDARARTVARELLSNA